MHSIYHVVWKLVFLLIIVTFYNFFLCVCVLTEEPVNDHVFQNQLTVPLSQSNADSSPDITPGHSPLPRSSSSANLQSASKLILSSKLVYSQRLDLPSGVELIRATPSAGMIIYSCIHCNSLELGQVYWCHCINVLFRDIWW